MRMEVLHGQPAHSRTFSMARAGGRCGRARAYYRPPCETELGIDLS